MFFIPWQFSAFLAILFSFLITIFYALIRIIFKISKINAVIISVITVFVLCAILVGGFITYVIVDSYDPCNKLPGESFHYYHDHLKSLCLYRENLAECPQDESQLKAFDPSRWEKVQKCGEISYSFSEENNSFEFEVLNDKMNWRSTSAQGDGFTFNYR